MVSSFQPTELWVENTEVDTAVARTALDRFEGPVHTFDPGEGPRGGSFAEAKRSLVLRRQRGEFLRHCPAGTSGLVCCNYLVLNLASNCPFDCSYCFLQEYLSNNPQLTVFTNVEAALAEVDAVLRQRPERSFRIGTGELSDSLALDPVVGLTRILVPFFGDRPNAVLELKTKSDCIDDLLALDPRGRVVVSWSLTPAAIASVEEPGTAPLDARIDAARRAQAAGYRLGFHFDPLVEFDGWEEAYRDLVRAVFAAVDPRGVAWVSLGSLRLSPGLEQAVRSRGPKRGGGRILGSELVAGADGKARVWRGLRLRMYRAMVEELRAVDERLPMYLCMEPPAVWQRVFGEIPTDRELGMRLAVGASW